MNYLLRVCFTSNVTESLNTCSRGATTRESAVNHRISSRLAPFGSIFFESSWHSSMDNESGSCLINRVMLGYDIDGQIHSQGGGVREVLDDSRIGVEVNIGGLKLGKLGENGIDADERLQVDLTLFILHRVIKVDEIAKMDTPRKCISQSVKTRIIHQKGRTDKGWQSPCVRPCAHDI